ncbi:MAG: Outer membrane protein assembly factor BamA precursor [Lentisphaerae bacterium ADurb.Bin242]|nr:MAG: Outer membrane protein assembly factor BamA precursor [Lentisphaerae bacterium ADurb.Bin242]
MVKRFIFPLLAVALLFPAAFSLQAEEISSVVFQQGGTYKFEEDVLRANVQSRKGATYSDRAVNDDIKRLHAMGMFSDVAAETKKTPDGKIDIIFKLLPKPVVSEIRFEGNKKYPDKKLMEEVKVVPNVPLNDMTLRNSADALRKFYAGKGLNDALVEPVFEKIDANHIRVIFKIKENLRLRVGDVSFKTVKGGEITVYKPDELRDHLANRSSFFSHPWFSWAFDYGLLDREELGRDKIRLRDLYWKKGYLDFKITDVQIAEASSNPEIANITFVVEEGEPYKVGKITFTGTQRFKPDELAGLIPMKPGQTYSNETERASADLIDHKYSRLGYADYVIHPTLTPNYKTHVVDVDYRMNEGQLFKINDIFISGNRYTKDYVIRRELPILPGDPVDKNLIKLSRDRLLGMGYFNTVEAVSIRSDLGPADTKDVDIRVDEKRFIDARIGATWSDSDSLSGMLEISHKNMDILDPWNYFTGGGQRMRLLAVMGLERYNFEIDFTEPWLFGIPLRWDISGYARNVNYDKWDERRIGFTTSLTKRIFDDFTSLSGGYTFEQVHIHGMSSSLSEMFQDEEGNSLVGRIHLTLDRDTRNSATDPTKGYSIGGLAAFTSQVFGASYNYMRLELKGTYHYSFINDWFVFSAGGKVGFLSTFDGNDMVPLYERYFLGGGDSIRGFPYRSIGPVDENNDNYGGQTMYILSTEISHPIYSIVRGAVFMDIGDSGADRFQFNGVNIGAGYGLRIKLPNFNTPLRLDLAFPVLNNQDGVGNSLRFHFNMGASFGPK